MQRIVGIGHSHLGAISLALREYAQAHPGRIKYTQINFIRAPYAPPFTVADGVSAPNPAWLATMREQTEGGEATVFLCLGGSQHWRWSLTPGPDPFDFVDPLQDDGVPPVGRLIPYELFMRQARAEAQSVRPLIDVVRGVTSARLKQFLSPPPLREIVLDGLGAESQRVLRERAAAGGGISPAHFRLKVWRAAARAQAEVCAAAGVECMWPPAAGIEPDGFLRADLNADTIHGTIAWGRLQLPRIVADEAGREEAA
jgi:hypothetical protein